jgi:NADH dehydrogenase
MDAHPSIPSVPAAAPRDPAACDQAPVAGHSPDRPRVLVLGGGYVGMYTALRLLRKLRPGEATVTVVDPKSYMTYQPFLPEAAAGSIQPRHVVVPLRRVLQGAEVVTGEVARVDHARKVAVVQPLEGPSYEIAYDHVVVAAGSISRTLPIPGLAEWGTGFKNVEEAIQLRNRVLECLDIAESTSDEEIRRRNLTFVVVGGGYAGIECLGELEDMARYATRYYRTIAPHDLRWVLVEASDRILPEVGADMGLYTLDELRRRGIECKLNTRLDSVVGGHVVLSDGTTLTTDTLVWTAGVRANPLVGETGFGLDQRGRIEADPTLRVKGLTDAWAAGDCAAVPDLTGAPGATTSPSAQHAVRQARTLADNIVATLRGTSVRDYRHEYVGSVASLGLYKGVAQVYGVKVKGFPAWFMHRTYHVSRVPTFGRKLQVVMDWTQGLFFRREIVSLWNMHEPFKEFAHAAAPAGGGLPSPERSDAPKHPSSEHPPALPLADGVAAEAVPAAGPSGGTSAPPAAR